MYLNGKKFIKVVRYEVDGVNPDDANATEADVLAGKTFYAGDEAKKEGTIPTYDGETTITENGTIETAGKYMKNDLVVEVEQGGGENDEMAEMEDIYISDTRDYTYKVVCLMYAAGDSVTLDFAEAYATSDGAFYESGEITHIWDQSKDKPRYDADGVEVYKTRYIIGYSNTSKIALNQSSRLAYCGLYGIWGDCAYGGSNRPYSCIKLVHAIDGSDLTSLTGGSNSTLEEIYIGNVAAGTLHGASFSQNYNLKKIDIDFSNFTLLNGTFSRNVSLEEVPSTIKFEQLTNMQSSFSECVKIKCTPPMNTINVTNFNQAFNQCLTLMTIPLLDLRSATSVSNVFNNCALLTNLNLKNIPKSITIGSGTSYGHLLTLDSLLNTIKELWDNSTGTSTLTLTVGSTNLTKLANVYVKLIDITDEMRAEDEFIDKKKPFVVCEKTDEGAMSALYDYPLLKNFEIK